MPFDIFNDHPLQRWAALGAFAGFTGLAFVYYVAVRFVSRRMRQGSASRLAAVVTRSAARAGTLFIFVLGAMAALEIWPGIEDEWRARIARGGVILLTAITAMGAANVFNAVIGWYAVHLAPKTDSRIDDTLLPVARRIVPVLIYGTGVLIILQTLGVNISPLLGGLGISGLAVALGLQPTLSNFFAGTNVLTEGAFTQGDYIELQGGPAGYVESVDWRSTKIRTWLNNYVVIPNSVLANTIMVNYSRPDPRMNILLYCGVSYDCNLARVNEVALEVARQVIADNDEADKSEDPWFGFERFGDSNVEFWVFLQAKDRVGSFIVTNDLIKRLHARFREEGIEINYPVRKVVYDAPPPPNLPPGAGGA